MTKTTPQGTTGGTAEHYSTAPKDSTNNNGPRQGTRQQQGQQHGGGGTEQDSPTQPAEEQEHHLTLRSQPTPSSSQTPSPPRGGFGNETEDSDVPASPIQQELQLYWNDNTAVYDTPAEQESLLSSKGSAYRQSLSEVLSTIFRTHLLTNETWHINARPAVLLPYIPADSGTKIEGTTAETSPHTTHPILSATSRCNSDSDIELADLQSSSSDDSDAQSARHTGTRSDSLESFNLPDLATNSLPTWDSQCSPEDLNVDQKNIYAILATLCTGHDLLAIQGLYRLYEELPWFPRGKDLSSDSLFDILFDSSLHTPSLIKYLKSSKVPHTTVEMCINIRAKCRLSIMNSFRKNNGIHFALTHTPCCRTNNLYHSDTPAVNSGVQLSSGTTTAKPEKLK